MDERISVHREKKGEQGAFSQVCVDPKGRERAGRPFGQNCIRKVYGCH